MKIAVGGFLHESHSFAPRPTMFADFQRPGGFPGLVVGADLVATLRGNANAIGGAIGVAEAAGVELVPLAWCIANPAGPVQDAAFERIAALICAALPEDLDGVYLDLHGAAVADSFGDAEGELLRRVRAIVGDVPVMTSLDPHANVTAEMAARSDGLSPYLTYPHVDMPAAGARAMRLLLARIALGRPFAKAFRQIDFWTPITSQCTLVEPMAGVMAARAAVLARTGAVEIAWCFGFPYADFPGCGAAVCAYAETQDAADVAADALVAEVNAREPAFVQPIAEAGPAVAAALRAVRSLGGPGGPVVIADTQDNPGGGGHGDTTGLLAELVRQGAAGAVVCMINDAGSAAACHAAGEGATLELSLGGKSDGVPFVAAARVLRLADGMFTLTGPMSRGNRAALGPTALVEVGQVQVVVVSRKMQAYDQAILRHVGIEPTEPPIIALKSSVHFRADFGGIAREVIVAAAPGPVVADPAVLPFTNVRPGVRRRPGANR